MRGPFQYCPYCAQPLQPFEDGDRLRRRCHSCGWIYYRNPTVGVAVVLLEGGHLLLGERRDGGWCIPCGHVEWDEPIEQAAVREFLEETGLHVTLNSIFSVRSNFHNPEQHTVGIWYTGSRLDGELQPGGDLLRVDYFPVLDLPELKFPTDREVALQLRQHYQLMDD